MEPKEKVWEYDCDLSFLGERITKFTITDHWQKNHPEISQELITKIVKRLNDKEVELTVYSGPRQVFRWRTTYQGKKYRLIFWFKDKEISHLWIRNCYPID